MPPRNRREIAEIVPRSRRDGVEMAPRSREITRDAAVLAQVPFEIRVSVCNLSNKEVRPLIQYDDRPEHTDGIVLGSVDTQSLGTLGPLGSASVTLSLIPLQTGVRRVCGLQLVDSVGDSIHEVGTLVEVHVECAQSGPRAAA